MKAQGKVQDLRLFFVARSHELFHINFISRVICFENVHLTFFIIRKEEVSASGLPSWLLELVPAVKYDINNVSCWLACMTVLLSTVCWHRIALMIKTK